MKRQITALQKANEKLKLPAVEKTKIFSAKAIMENVKGILSSKLDVDEVEICPWALREGIVLRRLDWLAD